MVVRRSIAHLRAARVLLAIASDRDVASCVTERCLEVDGHPIRHFAPIGAARREIVLMHGLTARGASDLRLVRLARLLAGEGVGCWVPQLPGLARFVEDCGDLELAQECVLLASEQGRGKTSLFGFSLGGGYALVLAARPKLAPLVEHVTAIGAHHDLDEVWRDGSTMVQALPSRLESATENELYGALACAAQRLTADELSPDVQEELSRTLFDFCDRVDLVRVRQLVRVHLLPHWARIEEYRRWPTSAALSPAGRLCDVRASVALLHATDDTLVAPEHTKRNYAALSERPSGTQTMLSTPLLEHVAPRRGENWRDIPPLLAAFASLL